METIKPENNYKQNDNLDISKIKYDYENQCYIYSGVIQDCNHPINMGCSCYGRENKGKKHQN